MPEETVICPECGGRKKGKALVCGVRDGRRFCDQRTLACSTCRGSGVVTTRHAALLATGQKLRDHRVHVLKRSGREEAYRLEMSPIQLNHQEHGRICAACPFEGNCPACHYTPAAAETWARERGRLPDA